MRWLRLIPAVLLAIGSAYAARQYSATAMVLKVDRFHHSFTASCQEIPGLMKAMTMPFEVRDLSELEGLGPGALIEFTLVVDGSGSYAEHIKVRPYLSAEQDPRTARQLKLLTSLTEGKPASKPVEIGSVVPNFTLTDQARQQVSLAQFAGKVVAVNFIYTSCALPNFCYRIANNFGVLQRRFRTVMGSELVLLTVTFDPQRDNPEVLANYSRTWKADPKTWHFLTGPEAEVRHVTDLFGMDYFLDEGLMNHSLHTAIINREGKLIANIEGNQFTAEQLADLVKTALAEPAIHN